MNIKGQLSETMQILIYNTILNAWYSGQLKGELPQLVIAAYHGAVAALKHQKQKEDHPQ